MPSTPGVVAHYFLMMSAFFWHAIAPTVFCIFVLTTLVFWLSVFKFPSFSSLPFAEWGMRGSVNGECEAHATKSICTNSLQQYPISQRLLHTAFWWHQLFSQHIIAPAVLNIIVLTAFELWLLVLTFNFFGSLPFAKLEMQSLVNEECRDCATKHMFSHDSSIFCNTQ